MSANHPLTRGNPPRWANSWGIDRIGAFAGFVVDGVEYRMRWIAPGRFLMGSPTSEAGRFDNEGPRHWVTITRGFWLGETPVTQALWEAALGGNPSRFKSPDRPVEQVSWEDCQALCDRLEDLAPGIGMRLPSEAEWEYACRAGTSTATHAGDLVILGERNAPLLDKIAWYGGNSGVDFDLDGGYDTSNWPDKQHPRTRAGTRWVRQKQPNAWGLYDMLGNVWEWCSDGRRSYSSAPAVDPVGPLGGDHRVYRGGSWDSLARFVRAGYRGAYSLDYRNVALGLRLARGQE